jgi:hypothetical protein
LDEVWEGDVPPEPPKSPPEIKGGRPRVKPDPEEEDELPF